MRLLITGGSGFIGSHLIAKYKENSEIINIDIATPKVNSHQALWKKYDVKDFNRLNKLFCEFKPTHVLHLAAKANLVGNSVSDYPDNTIGSSNVIECIKQNKSVDRFILTSTQFVVWPGEYPSSDDYLKPYTPYGESKAQTEKDLRESNCDVCWTIIRPTNIWGPWHPAFPKEMWPYLARGLYFHPGYKPIKKHYGYVENAIQQIWSILNSPSEIVNRRVFYITDPPIDNADWLNAFSIALRGKEIRRIPRVLWWVLAAIGDYAKVLKIPYPLSSERYFRMTVNENLPYEKTIDLAGMPRITLDEGVKKCIEWIEKNAPHIKRIK